MDQNIKSIPLIQLNIYQEINRDNFDKKFFEGIADIAKQFIGEKITTELIDEAAYKINLYFVDYFLHHGFSVPNWKLYCNFDNDILIPFFKDEYGNEIDISTAQYLIDYFKGQIPNNWWSIVK